MYNIYIQEKRKKEQRAKERKAMLEEKYSFRMVIFSESKEIQKLGQDYGIRVIPFLKFEL